jgi:hypothetical protein
LAYGPSDEFDANVFHHAQVIVKIPFSGEHALHSNGPFEVVFQYFAGDLFTELVVGSFGWLLIGYAVEAENADNNGGSE